MKYILSEIVKEEQKFLKQKLEAIAVNLARILPRMAEKLSKAITKALRDKDYVFHPRPFVDIYKGVDAYGFKEGREILLSISEYYLRLYPYLHPTVRERVERYLKYISSHMRGVEDEGEVGADKGVSGGSVAGP